MPPQTPQPSLDPSPRALPWYPKPRKGFTIIEALAVTGITGLIILVIYAFIGQSYRTEDFLSEQSTAVDEARKTLENMIQELRETSSGDDGSYALEDGQNQSIVFYSDIDTDDSTEKIRYFLQGKELKKGVIEPTGDPIKYESQNEVITTVAYYVENGANTVFSYYNNEYPINTNTSLGTPVDENAVQLIEIHLEINVTPEEAPETYTLRSHTTLRNLKTNL